MTRLNFTGRKRITRDRISLSIEESGESPARLHAGVDLTGLGVPDGAHISVEAYRQTTNVRFAAGTVGDPRPLHGVLLSEFATTEGLLFRVKVTAHSGPDDGKILAAADRIRARSTEGATDRTPLLPFEPADLGHIIWQLDLDDQPIVRINNRIGDWKGFARSDVFACLVYPDVLRRIVEWVLDRSREDDDGDPTNLWRRFLREQGSDPSSAPSESEPSERGAWIDDVVERFGRRHDLLEKARRSVGIGVEVT